MRAAEVFELTTLGGTSDFKRVTSICQEYGPYCLIGGLAVNCYVEPVYTLDAHLVVVSSSLSKVTRVLTDYDFAVTAFPQSVNVMSVGSELRIQFTTDARYQPFLDRSEEKTVLGERVQVAALPDVTQGKLWAYGDPSRRLSKRKKDELDLIRLGEAIRN